MTITIKDLRNHNGDLIFGVFAQGDGFPNVQAKSVYWEVKPAAGDSVTFTTRLPPGRYAAGVLHDENRSGDLDKGIGGMRRWLDSHHAACSSGHRFICCGASARLRRSRSVDTAPCAGL